MKKKQTAFKRGESYNGSPLDAFSQPETSVSSLSLRRSPDRNASALLNERETTLARVSNYIKREADRTANIMGNDTELQRAGVHFSEANAILNALDTYIFSQELIRKITAEYRRLRACALHQRIHHRSPQRQTPRTTTEKRRTRKYLRNRALIFAH